METIVRSVVVYVFLIFVLRVAGRRSTSEMTGFDLVLLLIIGDAAQQTLIGDDFSVTTALLVIISLIMMDVLFSLLKLQMPRLNQMIDGTPMVLVENGKPLHARLKRARVDEDDILASAREVWGVERMDQIKFAVLEASGDITIIPKAAPSVQKENRPEF